MTQPSPRQVAVETAVLCTEAGDWDAHAENMRAMGQTVAVMKKGRLEMGLFQVFVGAYDTVVDDVVGRSAEAATAMTNIGDTLRQAATPTTPRTRRRCTASRTSTSSSSTGRTGVPRWRSAPPRSGRSSTRSTPA